MVVLPTVNKIIHSFFRSIKRVDIMGIADVLHEVGRAIQEKYGAAPEMALYLDLPPTIDFGDFAVSCFSIAKQFKKSPIVVAEEVVESMRTDGIIASAKAVGPYVNLKLSEGMFFEEACSCDISPSVSTGKRVMVEYLSPNTNKPLHLGHTRNGVLGMAISNILVWAGYTVIKANLINNRGVHICKSMLAWQKLANSETPESAGKKGDHFVGDWYVAFAKAVKDDPSLEEEAQALLLKWEKGDDDTIALWKRMNSWVYAGFAETYKELGFSFDVSYFESDLYLSGKDIVQKGLKQGIFATDETGAIVYMLDPKKFGKSKEGGKKKKVLLRLDGTSVYTTQDLGVALKKAEDYGLDVSVYVVAVEQDDHFKILFDILKTLGYPWANQLHHLSYGMVELPNGRMKSREGTVVDADDLISEVVALATAELRTKNPGISEEEVIQRAKVIGIGAIKFYLLKSNPKQKIKFDPQESISFDGVTGPYCQYAYARACALINRSSEWVGLDEIDYTLLGSNPEERALAQQLVLFRGKLVRSAEEYNPSLVTNAVYELAKSFNQWYSKYPVADEGNPNLSKARLALTSKTASVLKVALELLGIEILDRM